jgi:hypothetical protein
MTSLRKEGLAVLGLVISPDVGLMISVALLAMIVIAAAMKSIDQEVRRFTSANLRQAGYNAATTSNHATYTTGSPNPQSRG